MIMTVLKELGIPKKHLKELSKQRYVAVVHKSWLKSLIKHLKPIAFIEKSGEIWLSTEEELGSPWMKIFVTILNKQHHKVIPLPRIRSARQEEPLLFPQLMEYIMHTNHVGLWKEAYKKYYAPKQNKETLLNLMDYNKVLRDVITRIYGCPIINIQDPDSSTEHSKQVETHLNIMPVACAVETSSAIFLLHAPHLEYNLNDCLMFSPAILDNSYTKSLFIIYQLLNILKDLHERSLTLGEISLNDVFVNEDMWIYVFPQIESNLFVKDDLEIRKGIARSQDCQLVGHVMNHNLECEYCGLRTYDKVQVDKQSLEELCNLWICGQISNFSYVSALNKLSGRVLGDPNCHYVFPWITDFASRCGKNWRDLKKSKYRLNKGDRQLDATYGDSQSQVAHHVSDVLSPITYYVYTARRTPAAVLRRNVRAVWVPAEYPASVQRIQEWTPDECVPEFYADASVFRSVHDDMEDLGVPAWAAGPEDFVERHRRALESPNVSEKLHHWIDLTFGYKLSGIAAVKARNVCLNLVDGHENLTKSGLVQLFSQPHPPKNSSSPYWSKIPPKTFLPKSPKQRRRGRRNSATVAETNEADPETSAAVGLPRLLSRSRSSLHEDGEPSRSPSGARPDAGAAKPPPAGDAVVLPQEYRPEQALEALERKHAFFSKTFFGWGGRERGGEEAPARGGDDAHGAGRYGRVEEQVACNYVDVISTRRVKELKVLGCLIVEIFMAKQLKSLGTCNGELSLEKRLENCISVIKYSETGLPPCISYIVNLLLQPGEYNRTAPFSNTYPAVTDLGLPPPSAHLLLEPLLPCALPFSRHLSRLRRLLANLKRFESVAVELDVLYHFDCDGERCGEFEALERTKVRLARDVAECKVKTCVGELEALLDDVDANTESEVVGIVLPYVKALMESPPTAVLAAWYLFEPLARALGPRASARHLLAPLARLYESAPGDARLPYAGKIARLYHHGYLLCLMVRLGLGRFLDEFVAALVEAVGGYKDCDAVDFVPHDHSEKTVDPNRKASHLKAIDSERIETSSGDESSKLEKSARDEEVFEFEEEKNSEDQLKFLMDHLQLNVTAEPAVEEAASGARPPAVPVPPARRPRSEPPDSAAERRRDGKPTVSETSADSLGWLSHRLGPLLTAKHLSRNLLKMLALCYVGKENLAGGGAAGAGGVSVAGGRVAGDAAAGKVLECLSNISGLYGEQIILYQYIPYMTEMILLCKKRLTPNLEGGLISCLALLKYIIPYFTDVMLMDQLQDVILENIVHPIVRLLNSSEQPFPSGHSARNALARKYLDVIYVLSIRIGTDMTKKYLLVPALQRFFLIFDRVVCDRKNDVYVDEISSAQPNTSPKNARDTSTTPESPPSETVPDEILTELRDVFTPELAHAAYPPFARLLGSGCLQASLTNHDRVRDMCRAHEAATRGSPTRSPPPTRSAPATSSGGNAALIGNRIAVTDDADADADALGAVRSRAESGARHLRGNWLAYWEYEIGRSEKNRAFGFKQIKLQTFVGHGQSVRCVHALDNENSFLSGSRDKTVKLWSLRSQGDGSTTSNCQWTYGAHKKSILSVTFVESLRLVASCDSVVHIWDPFMGANLGSLDSAKYAPVNVLRSMPAPSTLVFAATTDGTVKIIDTKVLDYVQELKISLNPSSGLIRCLAAAPSGRWLAAGQSSGHVTVLDARTGLVAANWRAHESEVLQLVACDEGTLVSTGLDQSVCVWSAVDGKFKFKMRGTTEPVHCLSATDSELISGTTANRIGVHSSVAPDAAFSNDKLRTDTFRGLLTSMDYLPLNRLLLLGADTGNINLLC